MLKTQWFFLHWERWEGKTRSTLNYSYVRLKSGQPKITSNHWDVQTHCVGRSAGCSGPELTCCWYKSLRVSVNPYTVPGTSKWGVGRVALVTGGGRRIGKRVATALHRHGYNLVLHCNSSLQQAQEFVTQLNTWVVSMRYLNLSLKN